MRVIYEDSERAEHPEGRDNFALRCAVQFKVAGSLGSIEVNKEQDIHFGCATAQPSSDALGGATQHQGRPMSMQEYMVLARSWHPYVASTTLPRAKVGLRLMLTNNSNHRLPTSRSNPEPRRRCSENDQSLARGPQWLRLIACASMLASITVVRLTSQLRCLDG